MISLYEVWPGVSYPLGAHWDGAGTNFSVFSDNADAIELCLFDEAGVETRIPLPERKASCFHCYVPDISPGQRYGFRAHGPWDPQNGHRFNPFKLLLDPYALAIDGEVVNDRAIYDHKPAAPDELSTTDSAPFVPRSVVVSPFFDWGNDRPPQRPRRDTILYETHVKGLTALHPDVPERLRGTYAGVAHPSVIDHLLSLGITAIELMPVHQHFPETFLIDKGLSNYWGYSTIGFFAPHAAYSSRGTAGEQVHDFKHMVRTLHTAGIEVILDVVYNHTCEGNTFGPTFAFKGLDNASYYRLSPANGRHYVDYTGTGNTVNVPHPNVLQLIMDSLRYWVTEMHVDGFRFDLASVLAREDHHVDQFSAFFDIIHQDPVLRQVKLIAEPWDVGEGGYQVGRFPPLWSEWNGKYRDTVRDFWRGEPGTLGEMAYRFAGSSDLYASNGRRPSASINFITAHDGFTMRDLVSYNDRHNEANGEKNADGERHNRSWNSGAEGLTDDPDVMRVRKSRRKSLMTTLLLSQGVPMILGGDELGRTQDGNNNTYCQDNALNWYDWEGADENFLEFTRRIIEIRTAHPVFRRRRFFEGGEVLEGDLADIGWFRPSGELMTNDMWDDSKLRALSVFLNGHDLPSQDNHGNPVDDDSFLVLFNTSHEPKTFVVPEPLKRSDWVVEFDTFTSKTRDELVLLDIEVAPWSIVLLREDKSNANPISNR